VTDSLSYLTLSDRLFEEEVAHKDQRRIESCLKTSGLPYIKTIPVALPFCFYRLNMQGRTQRFAKTLEPYLYPAY